MQVGVRNPGVGVRAAGSVESKDCDLLSLFDFIAAFDADVVDMQVATHDPVPMLDKYDMGEIASDIVGGTDRNDAVGDAADRRSDGGIEIQAIMSSTAKLGRVGIHESHADPGRTSNIRGGTSSDRQDRRKTQGTS